MNSHHVIVTKYVKKVRKWEKKPITVGQIKLCKWMPVKDSQPEIQTIEKPVYIPPKAFDPSGYNFPAATRRSARAAVRNALNAEINYRELAEEDDDGTDGDFDPNQEQQATHHHQPIKKGDELYGSTSSSTPNSVPITSSTLGRATSGVNLLSQNGPQGGTLQNLKFHQHQHPSQMQGQSVGNQMPIDLNAYGHQIQSPYTVNSGAATNYMNATNYGNTYLNSATGGNTNTGNTTGYNINTATGYTTTNTFTPTSGYNTSSNSNNYLNNATTSYNIQYNAKTMDPHNMTIAPQKLHINTSGSNTVPMNISYDHHHQQQQQQQYAALQQTLHLQNNQPHSYTTSGYNFQSQLKPEQTISPAVLTQTPMGPSTGINPAALTLQKTDNLQNNSSMSSVNVGNNGSGANNNELKRSYSSSIGDDLELENIIDDVEFEPTLKIQRTS